MKNRAIENLQRAALYWRTYVSQMSTSYRSPIWFNRLGDIDWHSFYFDALSDVTAIGGALNIPAMEPTPDGVILEAEEGVSERPLRKDGNTGFTGDGFLEFSK